MRILTLGLNHRTAPVEIRERLAFPENDQPSALMRLVRDYELSEAAILSTCNRSELSLAADGDTGLDEARRFLAENQGVDVATLASHFYQLSDSEAAIHLFRVASGIDSLVLGESQILSQVRQTLETAQQNGSARLLLNELFQRALRVGKRARAETDIGRGRLSISTAAVELASQIFDSLEGRHALLLGAGEMIELTAQYLMESGIARFFVANRTYERGAELARRFDGTPLHFEDFTRRIAEIDIVISSTAAPDFVLGEEALRQAMQQRRGRPLFLIDIAVPRDIDPKVRDLDNVFLFDIDDLKKVVETNRSEHEREILQVQEIIAEELGDFLHWFNSLGTGPLIKALRQHAQDLSQVELDRWTGKLAHLPEQDRQLIASILKGYANKLLHQPLVQVREFANTEDAHIHLDTVRRLFGLNVAEEPEESK